MAHGNVGGVAYGNVGGVAYGNVGGQQVITIQPQSIAVGKIVTATSFQQGCIWMRFPPI